MEVFQGIVYPKIIYVTVQKFGVDNCFLINTFIQQGHIQFIKSDLKDIYM